MPDQVGSAWTRKAQIDVVGIYRMEKTLILGECKWDLHPIGVDVLKGLTQKTDEIVPDKGKWKVLYLGFARTVWSNATIEYIAQVSSTNQEGSKWMGIGMDLLDLGKVDEDLNQWIYKLVADVISDLQENNKWRYLMTRRYTVNLPLELKKEAEALGKRQGVSLNQFILWSVAEKVSALKAGLDDPNFPGITYRRGASGIPLPVLRGTGIHVQTIVISNRE